MVHVIVLSDYVHMFSRIERDISVQDILTEAGDASCL